MNILKQIRKNIDDNLYNTDKTKSFRSDLMTLASKEYNIEGELFDYLYAFASEYVLANSYINKHSDVLDKFIELLSLADRIIFYYEKG